MYPISSYLLRGSEPRLRVLDEHGRPDAAAIARAKMLAPVVPLDEPTRARVLTTLARYAPLTAPSFMAKGAVAFGDADAAGIVREVGGLTVFIERPKGSVRTGTGPNGETWETTMQADYGFLPMTVCASDGEEVDAYVGENTSSPTAWVVSQVHQDGTPDEPKLMLGFGSEVEAVRCYLAHVPSWCFGGVTPLPVALIAGLMNIEPDEAAQTLKSLAGAPTYPAPERRARKVAKAGPQLHRCMGWHDGDDDECEDPYDCDENPYYEFIWADGRGHAWFCKTHAAQWLAASDREIVRARSLSGGVASKTFGDAPGARLTAGDIAMVSKLVALSGTALSFVDAAKAFVAQREPLGPTTVGKAVLEVAPIIDRADATEPSLALFYLNEIEASRRPQPAAQSKAAVSVGALDAGGRAQPTQVPKLDERVTEGEGGWLGLAEGRYKDIDFSVPQAVRNNLKRGLEFHEEGHSGDGLKAETVAWARRMANGENISPEKAKDMRAWLARHETDRKPNWAAEKTPGYVAWMLWGGDDAVGWSNKLVEQMEARDRADTSKAKTARIAKTARAFSVVKGWWASTSHIGQALPLSEAPPEIARAVSEMPLTETYPSPDDVGGWLGVIEPEDQAWIAFVAVDGRTLIWSQREEDGGVAGMPYYTYRLDLATTPIGEALTKGFRPVMKFRMNWLGPDASEERIAKDAMLPGVSAKPKRRIVYGVVLEPEPCDGQGDSQSHTYDATFVRDACHYYSQFRLINIDHKGAPVDPARARVVEIYIAPVDFMLDTPRGPQPVKRGSWVMGTEILCDELWASVESGQWNAYSVEGFSRSEPVESGHWNVKQVNCRFCSATWKMSVQKDRPFPSQVECPRCRRMTSSASN